MNRTQDKLELQLAALDKDGFFVLEDFLSGNQLARINRFFDRTLGAQRGRNNFEGERTERIYTLVARDPVFEELAEDARILQLLDRLFRPNYLLTASQAIVISPGETPQPWHTDDAFYTVPRPRPMISLSTIVAVEDFAPENGGTQLIPGSHRWSEAEVQGIYRTGDTAMNKELEQNLEKQSITVTMPAGACLVFAGTLVHRGGGNRSAGTRRALSNQYCEPWARPQENFFLGIPRHRAAAMSPTLQSLLGYSIHPPFMGQVTAYHPARALDADFVAPVERGIASDQNDATGISRKT